MNSVLRALILMALVLLYHRPALTQEVSQESPGRYSTRDISASTPMGSGNGVLVRAASTLRGELVITAADSPRVSVIYRKLAKTQQKSRAVDYIDLIAVALNRAPTGARLDLRAPNPPPWEDNEYGMVQAELIIPPDCSVEIDAAYFDVFASGPFSEFVNSTSLGRLEVSGVKERLKLVTANRRVAVEDARGDIWVSTTNSTLIAKDIECHSSPATFRNEGGDISIERITGEVNIKNSYGRIDIDGLSLAGDKGYIRCRSGPIVVFLGDIGDGQLLINNHYDDIEITVPAGLSAVLSLSVDEGGKIEAVGFPFRTELVQSTRLSLVAGWGGGLISSSVRGRGNIFVRGIDEGD